MGLSFVNASAPSDYLLEVGDLAGAEALHCGLHLVVVTTGAVVADVDEHLPGIALAGRFEGVLVDGPTAEPENAEETDAERSGRCASGLVVLLPYAIVLAFVAPIVA